MLLLLLVLSACDPDNAPSQADGPTDGDGDGSPASADCDDGDAAVHPGADEACNDADDDCDGEVDEDAAFYPDADGDGYGDATATPSTGACDAPPAGTVGDASDCDDGDAAISPAAVEVCDADDTDEDCDGASDDADTDVSEAGMMRTYRDADGDGYGDAEDVGALACDPAGGRVTDHTDCDDTSEDANPGIAEEVCGDGVDNDCDGTPGGCGLDGWVDVSEADAVLLGEAGDTVGDTFTIGSAGDVNGDGLSDLLIGAPSRTESVAYVAFGPVHGEFALGEADVRILASELYDETGSRVSAAGDMNGDGYGDILASDPYEDTPEENAGVVYLWYGPLAGDVWLSEADAVVRGEAEDDFVGASLAAAGDLDGDGFDDVLVGLGGEGEGGCVVVHGPVYGDLSASQLETRLGTGYSFSFRDLVTAPGDVDGDGLGDVLLLVGMTGRPELFYGPVEGAVSGDEGVRIDLSADEVSGAGDVDADGRADILIGDDSLMEGGDEPGGAYLLFGPVSDESDEADVGALLLGEDSGDRAGWTVAAAGDVDGDGYDDLLVAAPGHDDGGEDAGAVYLVYGPVSGTVDIADAGAKIVGDFYHPIGEAVASAGDVDGDGYDDLLIGSEHGGDWGIVYLFYGGPRY